MRRWIRALLLAGAVALVYAGFILVADGRALQASLRAFPAGALALALALVAAGYAIRSLRWRLYLHKLGAIPPLAFGDAFAMGLAPGKSGQVVKAYYLRATTGLPYRAAVPATFAERIADAVSIVLLLLVGLALLPAASALPTLGAALAFLASLLGLRHERAGRLLAALARRWTWAARHERSIALGHAQLRARLAPAELVAPAVLGLVGYLFEVLALQVLAEALGVPLSFGVATLAIALSDIAAMLSLVPGGVGVAEGGLVVVLALYGLPLATATALTLLFRACTLWFGPRAGRRRRGDARAARAAARHNAFLSMGRETRPTRRRGAHGADTAPPGTSPCTLRALRGSV